jgi:hypothetical protein
MPDPIPAEAVQAALRYVRSQPLLWQYVDEQDVRAIVEAAAPILAAQALRDAAEVAEATGTNGPHGARSPLARRTWLMAAKWLRARADNTIGDARG